MSATTRAELAARISNGEKSGRYDLASKAEVRAFVELTFAELVRALAVDLDRLRSDDAELNNRIDLLEEKVDRDAFHNLRRLAAIERRLDELELTRWQRVKRSLGIPARRAPETVRTDVT